MIISEKQRYIFVEIPRTGSTAIAAELVDIYGGESILRKHSNMQELLRVRDINLSEYTVIAGIRNPLDDAVSQYHKLLSNHKNNFTDSGKQITAGGFVSKRKRKLYQEMLSQTDEKKGFFRFLQRNFRHHFFPYTSNANINKLFINKYIRFENLAQDFADALKMTGLDVKRDIARINTTETKKEWLSYYESPDTIQLAKKIFSPYMKEFHYPLPDGWGDWQISPVNDFRYRALVTIRNFYTNFIMSGFLRNKTTAIRDFLE